MHPERAPTGYWRPIVRFEKDKVAFWAGLRNALGVMLAVAAGAIFGNMSAGLVLAIGALNSGYSDGQDSYRQRARRMSATALLGGLAVCAGGLAAQNHAAAVVLSAAFAFAAGMVVALGTVPGDVGMITLVTFLVFSAHVMTPPEAAGSGVLAFSGGMVQMALAVALWGVHRYQQEREALADLYLELARAARSPAPVTEAPPASEQSTRAQQVLSPLAGDGTVDSERYLALLSQTERIRLSLLALSRLHHRLSRLDAAGAAAIGGAFALAANTFARIAELLRTGLTTKEGGSGAADLNAIAEGLRTTHDSQAEEVQALIRDARHNLDALGGQMRAAWELTSHSTPEGLSAFARAEARRPRVLRLRGTATLRANLNRRSPALRHAVRLAICVMTGIALGRAIGVERSYWIPMTVAIVLKPDFTSTINRGVLRIVGTLAGLGIATALFHLLTPGAPALVGLIGLFTFGLRCFGPANYGIFAAAITAIIVLLFAATGIAPQTVIAARGWNTLAGGAIALVAYAAWPTWERTQIREVLAELLEAYRRYFQLVREAYLAQSGAIELELDRARLASRLARSNLEASFSRLRTEPGSDQLPVGLSTLLANLHRFIHALMSLEAGVSGSPFAPARAEFRSFANQVDKTLYLLAAALRGSAISPKDLPDLREAHHLLIQRGNSAIERYALVNTEADRITNSLNSISEYVLQLPVNS